MTVGLTAVWGFRLPLLSVAACCAVLAGCMVSEKAVFPPDSAIQPLKAGTYAAFEREQDRFKPTEKIVVRLRDDGRYDFVNEKGEVVSISLHQAGARVIAQAENREKPGKVDYAYLAFEIKPDEVLVRPFECDKQDKTLMQSMGVEVRGQYECRVDRVADPAAFFARIELGAATSRLARE